MQAVIGAQNPNPANAFTGAALYVAGNAGQSITSFPSLMRLTDIVGNTVLQNLALTNLQGLGVRLQLRSDSTLVLHCPCCHLPLDLSPQSLLIFPAGCSSLVLPAGGRKNRGLINTAPDSQMPTLKYLMGSCRICK